MEPNKLPLWQSVTKHKLKQNAQSYIKTAHYKNIAQHKKLQSNYYLSVASVDSSTTKSTCIFPETLNKRINACVENTSKKHK